MNAPEFLKDWSIIYLKHRDMMAHKIVSIDDKGDSLFIKRKDEDVMVLPMEDISGFESKLSEAKVTIVTFNTEDNLKVLISSWAKIKDNSKLSFIFINPESTTEKRWIIFPRAHALVADDTILAQGLRGLFETVDEVTPQILKKMVKD